jgi:hypothetical protein
MPDERSEMSREQGSHSVTPPASHTPSNVSRRALLRGASAALPTVLTLQSGAALAQSSNLIGTVKHASKAIGEGGRVQCLDMASAVDGTPTKLDLGDRPVLHVQYITQRQYYRPDKSGNAGDPSKPVTIEQMCKEGGVYWYKDGTDRYGKIRWKATLPGYYNKGVARGFLVSATALSSFASAIKVKSVF